MVSSLFLNYSELAVSPARALALDIAASGLAALAPETLLRRALRWDARDRALEIGGVRHVLGQGRLFVIGGGKAADVMASSLEKIIGPENIAAGLVICKNHAREAPHKIEVREAGHPVPDNRGLEAMAEILAMKTGHGIGEGDLVICLLSGGASALMPCPTPGITLEDKQAMTRMLLASGADIAAVNAVRRHLSASKGGKLGAHFAPAQVVSLIVSDVIGNDLAAIGSGPTVPDPTTTQTSIDSIRRFGFWDKAPEGVRRHLEENRRRPPLSELPHCRNILIGESRMAIEAMSRQAAESGKRVLVLPEPVQGDPESVARKIAEGVLSGEFKGYDVLLASGETTPKLPENPGQGGRNQHFALATLSALEKLDAPWAHLSLGSDGSDYLPDVAGALVDAETLKRVSVLGLSPRKFLDRFDSHAFFQKVGGCVATGPTGTNVGDLLVWVLGP